MRVVILISAILLIVNIPNILGDCDETGCILNNENVNKNQTYTYSKTVHVPGSRRTYYRYNQPESYTISEQILPQEPGTYYTSGVQQNTNVQTPQYYTAPVQPQSYQTVVPVSTDQQPQPQQQQVYYQQPQQTYQQAVTGQQQSYYYTAPQQTVVQQPQVQNTQQSYPSYYQTPCNNPQTPCGFYQSQPQPQPQLQSQSTNRQTVVQQSQIQNTQQQYPSYYQTPCNNLQSAPCGYYQPQPPFIYRPPPIVYPPIIYPPQPPPPLPPVIIQPPQPPPQIVIPPTTPRPLPPPVVIPPPPPPVVIPPPPQIIIRPPSITQPQKPNVVEVNKKDSQIKTEITLQNVINNRNEVNNPTNINANNTNNIIIHVSGKTNSQCSSQTESDGTTNTNCKQVEEVTHTPIEPVDLVEKEEEKRCCYVVSPKRCTQQAESKEWNCTHDRKYRCGSFCTNPVIYLKPRKTIYRERVLTIPPYSTGRIHNARHSCKRRDCPRVDCSGCINDGYSCSNECYNYGCNENEGDCSYVDETDFCDVHGGQGCEDNIDNTDNSSTNTPIELF